MTTLEHMPCDEDYVVAADALYSKPEILALPEEDVDIRINSGAMLVHKTLCRIENDRKDAIENKKPYLAVPDTCDYREAELCMPQDTGVSDEEYCRGLNNMAGLFAEVRRKAEEGLE